MYFLCKIMLDKFLNKLKLFYRKKRIRNTDVWNPSMARDVALAYKTVPLLLKGEEGYWIVEKACNASAADW
jgi:hypothetical protein